MNNLDIQEFLESIYSYIDKRIKDTSGSAAKIIGGTIVKGKKEEETETTNSGRYRVKINKFDDEVLNLWTIGNQVFNAGDNVFVIYWGDLTNARILCKNE